jgi:lipopolysaccharide transport system permease protein
MKPTAPQTIPVATAISAENSQAPVEGSQPPGMTFHLPDEPLVVIQPSNTWNMINLRDIWAYRELLFFLTWRDVKVRYKQTLLGAAWAILQPLFMMIIFTIFFGRLAGVESAGIPYPVFALAGLVPWTFFANTITASGNSLVGSAHLITKVYFPRLIVPAAAMLAGLVDFVLAFILLVILMFYYRVPVTSQVLFLPALVGLTALFGLGVGTWMSALNVKYRDVRFALPFVIQLWLFVSSVILPSSAVPEKWRWVLMFNPMSGIIEGYRSALFGLPFDWPALGIATGLTIAMLFYSVYSFGKAERSFADII